jgi:hypothetical protein
MRQVLDCSLQVRLRWYLPLIQSER